MIARNTVTQFDLLSEKKKIFTLTQNLFSLSITLYLS